MKLTITNIQELQQLSSRAGTIELVTELNLASLGLTEFPLFVCDMPMLRELELHNNSIPSLPPSLGKLGDTLERLSIGKNRLGNLPEEIGELRRLRTLRASQNPIEAIHPSVGDCRLLEVLEVDTAKLRELPTTFGQLESLQNLSLRGNALTGLPDALGDASNLEILVLSSNQFVRVPSCIMRLMKLRQLNLQANPIPEPMKEALRRALPHVKLEL